MIDDEKLEIFNTKILHKKSDIVTADTPSAENAAPEIKADSEKETTKQEEAAKENAEKKKKPEKIPYKTSSYILAALLAVTLIFFLSMRYIDRKAAETDFSISAAVEESSVSENTTENTAKININTAGKDELMQLFGIGDTRANAIIEYRENNGPYTDISEITEIDGIGESTFSKIKDSICVE